VKVPRPLINPLEAEEINRFLGSLRRYRDKGMILLLLLCGLRASEVLALKMESIDFENKRIRIWGKGGKERMLPLAETLIVVLRKYLTLERPEIAKTDYFFVVLHGNSRGQPLTYFGLNTIFRHWRIRSGIKKAHPHNFRHAFGTNMARYGVSLPVLQKMMGHTEFKHTMRYINLAMTDVADEYSKALSKIEEKYERADIT
jgi:integrase